MRRALPLAALLALACDDGGGGGSLGAEVGTDGATPVDADLDSAPVPDVADPDMASADLQLREGGADRPDLGVAVDLAFDAGDLSVADDIGADAGPAPTPCAPCEGDDDCPSGLCLEVGLRHFCGADCAADEDCAEGFECVDPDPDDDDDDARQCRPAEGRMCAACTGDDATCDGVDDDCDGAADEDYIGGGCADSCAREACVDGALSGCPDPPADRCDGVDDDCDGATDEDYAGGDPCGVGACRREQACVGGEVTCVPGEAAAGDATCDGADDDCDGTADEDYVTDDACGDGVCRRDVACVDGEPRCTPGEVLAETDVTCDAVDDDCDGRADDECQRNVLGFRVAELGDGFVDVDVVYAQDHSPLNDGDFWRPRAIDMRVVAPAALALRLPNNEGVIPGAATVAADKRVNIVRSSPTETRVTIISAGNANRIAPGVLVTMRYTHDGAAPPFAFGWNEARTNMAPIEALEVLDVEEAQIQ